MSQPNARFRSTAKKPPVRWNRDIVGKDMRQNTALMAGRPRRSVTLGRLAAWFGFAGAVSGQAALLAAAYVLADRSSENATLYTCVAAGLAFSGLVLTMIAWRFSACAQSSAVDLGHMPHFG